MSSRKISNDALVTVLNAARDRLQKENVNRGWFITDVTGAVSWNGGKDTGKKEVEAQLKAIQSNTTTIRDIEHAIAALDEEKDDAEA